MRKPILITLLIAAALFSLLVIATGFYFVVLVDSGCAYDDHRYHENGQIAVYGGHSWTGRSGAWFEWDADGNLDLEHSGHYTAGFRFHGLDDAEIRDYTDGRTRVEIDLKYFLGPLRNYWRFHGGRLPPSLELLPGEEDWSACFPGCRRPPIDPWGRSYQYVPATSEAKAVVYTYGRDGTPGGSGADADCAMLMTADPLAFTITDQVP